MTCARLGIRSARWWPFDALTKREDEQDDYPKFIERVLRNPLAAKGEARGVEDNMDISAWSPWPEGPRTAGDVPRCAGRRAAGRQVARRPGACGINEVEVRSRRRRGYASVGGTLTSFRG